MEESRHMTDGAKKFNEMLKEAVKFMKPEDIERALEKLGSCRTQIYTRDAGSNMRMAYLLADTEKKEHVFRYERNRHLYERNGQSGSLKVLGVSLPKFIDVGSWRSYFPQKENFNWWTVHDGGIRSLIYNNGAVFDIHPLLVTENLEVLGIMTGDRFRINAMEFIAVSSNAAVLLHSIGACSNKTGTESFNLSMPKFCIDGWYTQLIKDNEELCQLENSGKLKGLPAVEA